MQPFEQYQIPLEEYQKWADTASMGFKKAAKFLVSQKIFTRKELPYRPQVTALATIFGLLDIEGDKAGVKDKIARWYWCGVFGELYGSASETRIARDVREVINWVRGGSEPNTVSEANFDPNRLLNLRTRNSAAYKGLSAILMREGGRDLLTGQPIEESLYFDENLDIHHIFPKAWCQRQGIDRDRYDCIVNKTPLSSKTNRSIGGRSPSQYLRDLQNKADISLEKMDEFLHSHAIVSECLHQDNFDRFFELRREALLDRIEMAMGKRILRDRL